jgi:hypothetical protein
LGALCLLAGCSGGGGGAGAGSSSGSGGGSGGSTTSTTSTLSGTAIKGPFKAGSIITATQIDGTGRVQGTVSNNQGAYSITVTWTGPTKIEVTGTYADELNNNQDATVPAGDPIAVITEAVAGTTVTAHPNLITSIAAKLIEEQRAAGTPVTSTVIQQANRQTSQAVLGQQIDALATVDLTKAKSDEKASKMLSMQLVLASAGTSGAAFSNAAATQLAKNIRNGRPLGSTQDGTAISSTVIQARLAEIQAGGNITVGSSQVALTTVLTNLGTASGAPTQFDPTNLQTAGAVVGTAVKQASAGVSDSLLFAVTSQGFRAINPADPGGPSPYEIIGIPNPFLAQYWQGTYNSATFVAENLRLKTVVYVNQFLGQVFKITALKQGSFFSTEPSRISSEEGATSICSVSTAVDYVNHDDSQFLYSLKGSATSCRDLLSLQWKMVRLGDSATTPPTAAKRPISVLYDSATGAITGWLARDGAALKKYDKQFLNPTTILSDLGASELVFVGAKSPTHMLLVRFGSSSKRLVTYALASGAVSPLYTATGSIAFLATAQDNEQFYFADGLSIYKVPLNGSAAPTLLHTATSSSLITQMEVTDTKVAFVALSTSLQEILQTIPKSGGTATVLAQRPMPTGQATSLLTVTAGDWVYYQMGTTAPTAGVVKDDGSRKTETSGQWVGVIAAPTDALFGVNIPPPLRLLRHTGSQVFSVVATIGECSARLMGTVPSGLSGLVFSGSGNQVLGRAASGSATTKDAILSVNTDVENSLVRSLSAAEKAAAVATPTSSTTTTTNVLKQNAGGGFNTTIGNNIEDSCFPNCDRSVSLGRVIAGLP